MTMAAKSFNSSGAWATAMELEEKERVVGEVGATRDGPKRRGCDIDGAGRVKVGEEDVAVEASRVWRLR